MPILGINECQKGPCQHNGTCMDAEISYILSLILSFSDIDECQSGPCQNDGTCIDGIDSFSCKCMPGWAGTKCETSKQIWFNNAWQ